MRKRIFHPGIVLIALLLVATLGILGFSVSASSGGASPAATSSPTLTASPATTMDIVDIAIADGRFTTLVAAIQAAGLEDTLRGAGPFTVFAPTDDAFDKLPAGTVDALLTDIPALTNILLYHVVEGQFLAGDILNVTTVDTVQKESLEIGLTVNDAKVIIPDIMASNGVIHVIDTVLLPPAAASPTASPAGSPTKSPRKTP